MIRITERRAMKAQQISNMLFSAWDQIKFYSCGLKHHSSSQHRLCKCITNPGQSPVTEQHDGLLSKERMQAAADAAHEPFEISTVLMNERWVEMSMKVGFV